MIAVTSIKRDSQVDDVTPVLEDQTYFLGFTTTTDWKTTTPKRSETFTSECSELSYPANSLIGIVKCTKNDGESMTSDVDG